MRLSDEFGHGITVVRRLMDVSDHGVIGGGVVVTAAIVLTVCKEREEEKKLTTA